MAPPTHRARRPARAALAPLSAGCLLLASCGPGRPPVYPVRGQILDGDNKPAADALVIFHPVNPAPAGAPKPTGRTDERGHFTLTTHDKGDGAPEGEYAVTVEWRLPKKGPFDPAPPDRL